MTISLVCSAFAVNRKVWLKKKKKSKLLNLLLKWQNLFFCNVSKVSLHSLLINLYSLLHIFQHISAKHRSLHSSNNDKISTNSSLMFMHARQCLG